MLKVTGDYSPKTKPYEGLHKEKDTPPKVKSPSEYKITCPNIKTPERPAFLYNQTPLPSEIQSKIDEIKELQLQERLKAEEQERLAEHIDEVTDADKSAQSINDLDMDEILSIELPQKTKGGPIPFELGDKYLTLDKYQQEAIDEFNSGKTSIVTAPTGTGKTLIAEYGIDDILKKGKKVIYLSPLKALSNEKYTKFSELFGNYGKYYDFEDSKNVGIITGDIAINPDAQLLVMTTEIYRNMLTCGTKEEAAEKLKDFDAVIYDEFHYMNDPDRGKVWEESVMNTPKHMKQMMLSATASNAPQIAEWVNELNPEKKVALINVPETERHVPLKEYVFGFEQGEGMKIQPAATYKIFMDDLDSENLSDRQVLALNDLKELYQTENPTEKIKTWKDIQEDGAISTDKFTEKLIADGAEKEKAEQIALVLANKNKAVYNDCFNLDFPSKTPKTNALIKILNKEDKTPALFFVFSKKNCQKYCDFANKKVGTLLTPEQSKQVLDRVNDAKEKGIYLGKDFDENCLNSLMKGYAVHHAGMLPAYKSLVEGLAREGLVKVCFATETLIAGINMPFKTVVLTSLNKSNGSGTILLPNSTFKQGSGRSGRRGIDNIGNVIIMPKSRSDLENFYKLLKSTDTSINSQYKATYSSLLSPNMLNHMDETLKNTFAYYQKKDKNKNILTEAQSKKQLLESMGYVQKDANGIYSTTEKGDIAKKIFGVNEIVMTEILTDPKYTKDMSSAELAGLMAIFADVKDDNPKQTFSPEYKDFAEKAAPAIEMANYVKGQEYRHKIYEKLPTSTSLATSILKFAQTDITEDDPQKVWKDMINELREKHLINYEGDMLRVVNGTIDLLHTMSDVAENDELKEKADSAIEMLKKPPITDILKYELNA
ncbi:MAG: DEAD/DEAH box helicase [Candidatus Gastranaerophilales bacterium]|nr:DEAD/DEAH box helicase [Candidatus Gastranaerophilales bacterium]